MSLSTRRAYIRSISKKAPGDSWELSSIFRRECQAARRISPPSVDSVAVVRVSSSGGAIPELCLPTPAFGHSSRTTRSQGSAAAKSSGRRFSAREMARRDDERLAMPDLARDGTPSSRHQLSRIVPLASACAIAHYLVQSPIMLHRRCAPRLWDVVAAQATNFFQSLGLADVPVLYDRTGGRVDRSKRSIKEIKAMNRGSAARCTMPRLGSSFH